MNPQSYPAPPWPEPAAGSVLAWRTRVGASSYTYVGLHLAGHGWYLTGQVTAPLSWSVLCYHLPPEDGRFLVLSVTGQLLPAAPHPSFAGLTQETP